MLQSTHRNWFYAASVLPESSRDRFLLGTCIWRLMASLTMGTRCQLTSNQSRMSSGILSITAAITSFCSWLLRFDLWRVVFLCFHLLTVPAFVVVAKHYESHSPYSLCKLVTTLPVNVKCLHPYLFNKKQQSGFVLTVCLHLTNVLKKKKEHSFCI